MPNPTATLDIGAKLWSLCHVLRDDGVTYHQYLSELTYLLFLKMMKETGQEDRLKVWKRPKKSEPPVEQPGTRWDDLLNASAPERLDTYKEMLLDYGLHGRGAVQEIYANANTFITKPATLSKLVTDIDSLDWYSVDRDDLRDGGAAHFVECIRRTRELSPRTRIEILTPDFRGRVAEAAVDHDVGVAVEGKLGFGHGCGPFGASSRVSSTVSRRWNWASHSARYWPSQSQSWAMVSGFRRRGREVPWVRVSIRPASSSTLR